MKLAASLLGEEYKIELRREGARVFAEVGGRRYELEARETEAGVYLLLFEGSVYECRVETDAGGASRVSVRDKVYEVTLTDPKRLRGAGSSSADTSGRAEIKAPMPGKVVRVLVEAGAAVEAGDGLVVVEAMKMQNEMKSPKAGTVVELHARTGATVNAGDVLVVVE
jgi:biotin carboxyl carrier protein